MHTAIRIFTNATHVDVDDKTTTLIQGTGSNYIRIKWARKKKKVSKIEKFLAFYLVVSGEKCTFAAEIK